MNYLEFFCLKSVSTLPKLFTCPSMQLSPYKSMDVYFILLVIFPYCCVYFDAQIILTLDIWGLFHLCFILFLHFLTFLPLQGANLALQSQNQPFLQGIRILSLENSIRSQRLGCRSAYCYRDFQACSYFIASRTFQLIDQENVCLCVHLYLH